MITTQKFKIPIYGVDVMVHMFDTYDEAQREIPNFDSNTLGCVQIDVKNHICHLCVPYNKASTTIHELEHLKNAVWDIIGYKPNPVNDEPDAYLIEYLWTRVYKVFEKHKKDLATQC